MRPLDEISKGLLNMSLADALMDSSGSYWDRDHWVSSGLIAAALVGAYKAGIDDAKNNLHENGLDLNMAYDPELTEDEEEEDDE